MLSFTLYMIPSLRIYFSVRSSVIPVTWDIYFFPSDKSFNFIIVNFLSLNIRARDNSYPFSYPFRTLWHFTMTSSSSIHPFTFCFEEAMTWYRVCVEESGAVVQLNGLEESFFPSREGTRTVTLADDSFLLLPDILRDTTQQILSQFTASTSFWHTGVEGLPFF